jgi:hypothetical protein
MADAFSLRLSFSSLLRAFNPCDLDSGGTDEAVALALKYRETMDEDFHAVILEQLRHKDNNINVRANIVYFLEDLVDAAKREMCWTYVHKIERDWGHIVNSAIPLEGADDLGIVNVNAVRYVLQVLHFEHGLWAGTKSYGHTLVGGEEGKKSYEYWTKYLNKRAVKARPELLDSTDDEEEEEEEEEAPDMSWIYRKPMPLVERRKSILAESVAKPSKREEAQTAALHSIRSPPGSRPASTEAMDIHLDSTPEPPTPPPESESPSEPASAPNGTVELSLSGAFQKVVAAYTPVQKQDFIIFEPENFDPLRKRMEQDRERQRRKEDNSGFVRKGNLDEELIHVMMTGKRYLGGDNEERLWAEEAKLWEDSTSIA